jgi:hypothetical protein
MKKIVAVLILLCASSCANQKYYWGDYDSSLYHYYKNPAKAEDYEKELKSIIEKGEATKKVPPGIYAEYGYQLMLKKDWDGAAVNFEKEKTLWPESASFMDSLVKRVQEMK